MDLPRTDQMRREMSEMGNLYLLVIMLVLIGAILVQFAPRAEVATLRCSARERDGPGVHRAVSTLR